MLCCTAESAWPDLDHSYLSSTFVECMHRPWTKLYDLGIQLDNLLSLSVLNELAEGTVL